MQFLIADTFTDSLDRLSGDEQRAAKTTAFDLQVDPSRPGMKFHRLAKSKDKSFFSVRVNDDLRLIVHRTDGRILLCYVGHHDAAYAWAERRVVERHPTTGAAQLVEVRKTIREIEVPAYVPASTPASEPASNTTRTPNSRATMLPLFAGITEQELMEYGVPSEWVADVQIATEDTLFDLTPHLPAEASEALVDIATGGTPRKPVRAEEGTDPFAHPDAQRRFRMVTDSDELARALAYPWEKWTVFLHPDQRDLVERRYNGPARVAGSAGTGKTVVALHRTVHLARAHPQACVLLTTFNDILAGALRVKLGRLAGNDRAILDQITVASIDSVGLGLHTEAVGAPDLVDAATVRELIRAASQAGEPHRFSDRFLETEWRDVVDAWQLDTWDAYRDVARLGRKTRLGEKQRAVLWATFDRVRDALAERSLVTVPGVFARVTEDLTTTEARPYDFAVVDEAQDISVPQLRFLAALGGGREDALYFAGDLGQRIFQTPFSWRSLGVDVRGRSHTLRINYRTSHQIRRQADRLLGSELADVDGNVEVRAGTISAFHGPEPEIRVADSVDDEASIIVGWIGERLLDGLQPHDIGIFVRSDSEIQRAFEAVQAADVEAQLLDGAGEPRAGAVAVGTMHLAKGLEFRAVIVAACDDEVLPSQTRIESVADEADLEDVYETERQLLYVACTRARDYLLVIGVEPTSEFLDDLIVSH